MCGWREEKERGREAGGSCGCAVLQALLTLKAGGPRLYVLYLPTNSTHSATSSWPSPQELFHAIILDLSLEKSDFLGTTVLTPFHYKVGVYLYSAYADQVSRGYSHLLHLQ